MSRHNTGNKQGLKEAHDAVDFHASKGNIIDIKKTPKKRSLTQNNALHLFFKWLAIELNELGIEFEFKSLIKESVIYTPYTKEIVKKHLWAPLQKELFNIESTKDLESKMINEILDILTLWFSKHGIPIKFPNKIDLLIEQLNKNESLQN